MILISHNMNDVLAVADDIAVLYLGRITAQVEAKDVTHSEVVELITGGALVERGAASRGRPTARRGPDGPTGTRRDAQSRRGRRHEQPRRPSTSEIPPAPQTALGDAFRDYVARVRGGDVGPLPAILGLVVLFIVFSVAAAGHVHQLVQLRQPADPERRRSS